MLPVACPLSPRLDYTALTTAPSPPQTHGTTFHQRLEKGLRAMSDRNSLWPRSREQWARVLLVALLYGALGRLSFALAVVHDTITNVVFVSEGVALAFALRHGHHVLPGIFLGQGALALSVGLPLPVACMLGAINSVQAALGILVFHRAGLRIDLRRLRDVLGIVLLSAALLQPLSATLGTLVLRAAGLLPVLQWPQAWLAWWTGNVLGQVLFTSLLLAWWSQDPWRAAGRPSSQLRVLVSATAALTAAALISLYALHLPLVAFAASYPVVTWIAIQYGPRGATLVSAVLCLLATALASQGLPPFAQAVLLDRIFLLDLFVFSNALTALMVAAMVAQYRHAELSRRANQERMELAFAATQDGVWDWNLLTGEVYYSPRWKQMLGYAEDEIAPHVSEWEGLLHPDDRAHVQRAVQAVRAGSTQYEVEFRLRHRDGHYVHILSRGHAVRPALGGVAVRFVGTHFDLTERKLQEAALRAARDELESRVQERTAELTRANADLQREVAQRQRAEESLYAEKERAQITLASIGDGVITTDPAGCIETMNAMAEQLVGCTQAQTQGQAFAAVFHAIDERSRQPIDDPVAAVLRSGQIKGFDDSVILVRPDGSELFISDSAAPIRDRNGQIVGAVIVFRDVTVQHHLVRAVSYQASHDVLTGALNRAEFERRLGLMLEHARSDGHHHALCYLDLDEFKVVNDTCGHSAGDELLRQVTELLRERLRDRDTLARLGGDEFGILLGDCGPREAVRIAEQLRQRMHDFRFAWQDKSFTIGVSIGLVPINAVSGDLAALMSQADGACYLAKEKGRNRVHLHQPGDEELEHRRSQMRWVNRLDRARDDDRLRLYYQPITALHNGVTAQSYGEVLLRFVEEDGEVLYPSTFIPAAERFHQMQMIDRWVVRRLFTWLADADADQPAAEGSRRYAVNLSGQSLGHREFLDFVSAQFDATGIAADRICFEITETAAIAKLDAANRFITTLKSRGCRFALDDFGSGLSSFGYLKSLPVDYLKIDGRFVRHMVADPVDRVVVESIQRIGRAMGLQTIGECVEDELTLSTLREAGVDYAQGFVIARPAPLPMH